MVTVKRKVLGRQTYYYLVHTVRRGVELEKKELYLGKEIPRNVEELKRDFLDKIYREKWRALLDRIRKGFSAEIKQMPRSVREKEVAAFAVRFTYDTQRIEGSKLTLRETANLLERGITPRGKPLSDVKEAEAHRELLYEVMNYRKNLSLQTVLLWQKKLFQATKPDIAGQIRKHQVTISGSRFMPPFPAELPPLLREFFGWYHKNESTLHPVELAALVHLKFVTIHPFSDGNGRISRLMMNFALNKNGFPMFNIPYEGRSSYYNALESSQIKKIESILLQWFMKRYIKENKRYLRSHIQQSRARA